MTNTSSPTSSQDSEDTVLARLSPRLATLAPESIKPARVDADRCAIGVLALLKKAEDDAMLERLRKLPASEFDIGVLDVLRDGAVAIPAVRRKLDRLASTTSQAKVSVSLIREGTVIKNRIFSLLEYNLADVPLVMQELADIRSGNGHLDLLVDLVRLAGLHAEHDALINGDRRNYRPDDAAEARRVSTAIRDELAAGQSREYRDTSAQLDRIFTVTLAAYDDLRDTVLWLRRKDPAALRDIPSLWQAARAEPASGPAKPTGKPTTADVDS